MSSSIKRKVCRNFINKRPKTNMPNYPEKSVSAPETELMRLHWWIRLSPFSAQDVCLLSIHKYMIFF